jgi:hypothetical protein
MLRWWSSHARVLPFSTFSSVFTVIEQPGHSSSSASSLPVFCIIYQRQLRCNRDSLNQRPLRSQHICFPSWI